MVLIQLDLTEDLNEIVRTYMAKNSLTSKGQAVNRIIEDYDYLQTTPKKGKEERKP